MNGRPRQHRLDSEPRKDSWQNIITNVGTNRDPRMGAQFSPCTVYSATARMLWRSNDLAARIIETHAAEALRKGFELKLGEGQQEESEEIEDFLKDIPGPVFVGNGLIPIFKKALQYEAAYGGCAIWPVVNGAQGDLSEPLDENTITSIERLMIFEPRELRPMAYYTDPLHPKFGEVALYEIVPLPTRGGTGFSGGMGGQFYTLPLIHESRLIIFPGIRVSREEQAGTDPGWGDNKLSRVYQVLADFDLSFAGAAALLAKFSQVVFKLKGLATTQATNPEFKDHLEAMNVAGSILNAWVVDSEDSVDRMGISMAGLSDTLDKLMLRLAAAAEMPVSLLMGQAPAGLNATGDSDIRFFYDRVDQLRTHLKPRIEQLIRWILLSADGPTGGQLPDNWCVEFPALWEPSQKELIATRKDQAMIDDLYINNGTYSPEECAKNRFGGDTYSFDTTIDFEARARLETAVPKAVAIEGQDPNKVPPPPAPTTDKPADKPADKTSEDKPTDGENADRAA